MVHANHNTWSSTSYSPCMQIWKWLVKTSFGSKNLFKLYPVATETFGIRYKKQFPVFHLSDTKGKCLKSRKFQRIKDIFITQLDHRLFEPSCSSSAVLRVNLFLFLACEICLIILLVSCFDGRNSPSKGSSNTTMKHLPWPDVNGWNQTTKLPWFIPRNQL